MIPKKGKAIVRKAFRGKKDNSPTRFGFLGSTERSFELIDITAFFSKIQETKYVGNLQIKFDYELVFGLPLLLALKQKDYSIAELFRDFKILRKVSCAQQELAEIFNVKNESAREHQPTRFKIYLFMPEPFRILILKCLSLVPIFFVIKRVEAHFRAIENQSVFLSLKIIENQERTAPTVRRLLSGEA